MLMGVIKLKKDKILNIKLEGREQGTTFERMT